MPLTSSVAVAGETFIVVNTDVPGAELTGFTVTDAVPLIVPFVAVIVVVPAASAINEPVLSIVPIVVLLLLHVTIASIGLLFWSKVVAVNA